MARETPIHMRTVTCQTPTGAEVRIAEETELQIVRVRRSVPKNSPVMFAYTVIIDKLYGLFSIFS